MKRPYPEVSVTNTFAKGIEMGGTPWSDGVPGVTQRPIKPSDTFSYKFKAAQHGSYWYHSHLHDQIQDGLYGAILIRPRGGISQPFHLIDPRKPSIKAMMRAERRAHPLILYDMMRTMSQSKWNIVSKTGVELTCYDSILFNGKGRIQCLSENQMTSNLSPLQKGYLALVPGQKLTDKGCLPAAVIKASLGADVKDYNKKAMPEGIFEGCKETKGSTEVIRTRASWFALDIIGAINFVQGFVSIDGYDMWVYALDGSYIEPQKVQALAVSSGNRYSVLIKTNRNGKFQIRFRSNNVAQMITGNAVLQVGMGSFLQREKPQQWIDITGNPLSNSVVYFSQENARPYPPRPIPAEADALHLLSMRLDGRTLMWALNNTPFTPQELENIDPPILFNPQAQVSKQDDVTIVTKMGTWVDLVFSSTSNMPPHPIHKHGDKMYRIGSGTGLFKWKSVKNAIKDVPENFNLINPPIGDTFSSLQTTDRESWVVMRYQVTSPGAWLLHCHVNNHVIGGMMMVIIDGLDVWRPIPKKHLKD
ncbi:hypothetical protein QQS21_011931 [Conoideocrella luteorostrata]|uniref:Multicopper oxidase n=1 Tax=Conoideocrella luteorostrata TaxID=1105319 RepID=A0AAJ0CC73_9HYPO|nr:hypothetical protein QQS21_011931 [Conoideocrella luteorostrata]